MIVIARAELKMKGETFDSKVNGGEDDITCASPVRVFCFNNCPTNWVAKSEVPFADITGKTTKGEKLLYAMRLFPRLFPTKKYHK